MFELGDSVMVGDFSGFIACFFEAEGETWAKVSNFEETSHTTQKVQFLDIIT